MPIPEVRLTVSESLLRMDQDFQRQNREIYDDEALDLADELQRESPVGATGELRAGWDVIPARRQIGSIRSSVVNTSDNAFFRIVGRGPGKMPPVEPIDDWVRAKAPGLSDSERRSRVFLVRRKISLKGTERWREQDNVLGLKRGQTPDQSPKVQETRQKIIDRVNQIQLPERRRRRRRRR